MSLADDGRPSESAMSPEGEAKALREWNAAVAKGAKEEAAKEAAAAAAAAKRAAMMKRDRVYDTGSNYRWYKTFPYGFRFINRKGEKYTIYLPINPNDITITTHFATNVLATLYGTVEEHSEQRYFDIEINGTTGMTPKYLNTNFQVAINSGGNDGNTSGRASFKVDAAWSDMTFGIGAKTLARAQAIKNKAADLFTGRQNETGVLPNDSGYAAFHNLYRFFLQYKINTSGIYDSSYRRPPTGEISSHPLWFLNYKDNNRYKCAIQRFTLKRTANDPMLYNYNIVLRAYELSEMDVPNPGEGENKLMRDLGLDGVKGSSVLGKIKQMVNGAKGILGATMGGINTIGR
jgi:hypothetical protein